MTSAYALPNFMSLIHYWYDWRYCLLITTFKKYLQQQSDKLTAGFLPFFSNVLRRRQPSHSYFAVYMSGERTRSTELSRLQHTRLTHQRPNYLSLLDSYIFSYQELGTAHNKGIKSRVDGNESQHYSERKISEKYLLKNSLTFNLCSFLCCQNR